MNDKIYDSSSVLISELPAVHIAYLVYKAKVKQGDLYNEIHQCFQHLQKWVQGHGLDPFTLQHIGIPVVQEGQIS